MNTKSFVISCKFYLLKLAILLKNNNHHLKDIKVNRNVVDYFLKRRATTLLINKTT